MKNSIRILIAAASLAIAAPAAAQGGGGGGGGGANAAERQAQMRARMFEGITLTAEQTAKIDTVQAATVAKRREMMQGGGDMRSPEMREKMMGMQQEERKSIRAILTAEQAVIFDKNIEAMMARRGGR